MPLFTPIGGGGIGPASVTATTGSPNIDSSSRAGKTIYNFTGSGSITIGTAGTAEVFVLGGGGGGGTNAGGGGGAGGLYYKTSAFLPAGTLTVTIGAGGSGSSFDTNPISGNSSRLDDYIGIGGGAGGLYNRIGYKGGSGGGGGLNGAPAGLSLASTLNFYGNNGASNGGGGGGAFNGGNGGGGGAGAKSGGVGGAGAPANTGSAGGGEKQNAGGASSAGSGIIIVRYTKEQVGG